jgi:hypothetical protein
MGEPWFKFVQRVQKEEGIASFKDAMKRASARKKKGEWKHDGRPVGRKSTKKRSKRSGRKSRKTRRRQRGGLPDLDLLQSRRVSETKEEG